MAPIVNNLQWKIGGESGFGIKVTGQMFTRACIRGGLWTFDYTEYPSLIRGGHNSFQVIVRDRPVHAPVRTVNLLVALNGETVSLHQNDLAPGSGVLYDPSEVEQDVSDLPRRGVVLFAVPMNTLAREAGGNILMRNVVALGSSMGLFHYDFRFLEEVIHVAFDRKGTSVVDTNIKAARAGFDYVSQRFSQHFPFFLKSVKSEQRMVITGNTAICLGALKAGLGFFAGYPMTPTTSILSFLAKHASETGMVVRHAEDEIAVINSAIGAAYAGVRSMVATAGGGFSLMVEGVGLAAMVEAPIVIVEGQRPGPSTGLPTWTGQGDLQFILHASQDEFPRIVIAPGDVNECFYSAFHAFNLAERYQTPVFILTDKFLAESHLSIPRFETKHLTYDRGLVDHEPAAEPNGIYKRYRLTDTGISPRTLPGTPGGVHIANSDEHDEYGFVDETVVNRVAMMEKRMRKTVTALRGLPMPTLYGPQHADLTLIGWGSTKGPVLDALKILNKSGLAVNFLHFVYLHPLPIERLMPLFRSMKTSVIIENNSTGQFGQHLKAQVGFLPEGTILKYDGRPFLTDDVVERVLGLLKAQP